MLPLSGVTTGSCGGVGPEHTRACPHYKRAPGDEDNINIYRNINSGGQSTQIKYLSKSTDTYNKILLQ